MASSKKPAFPDAIALLKADHEMVQELFKQYDALSEEGGHPDERAALAQKICTELTIHTQIEEEIFYPAARKAMDEQDLIDEAEVEHASVKDLISQLAAMRPDEPLFDAKVKVLGEYIRHHIEEEHQEMFPEVRRTDLDLKGLGETMAQRKDQLKTQLDEMLDDATPQAPLARRGIGAGSRAVH